MIGHYGSYGSRVPAPDDALEQSRRRRTVQSSTGRTAVQSGYVGRARAEQMLADTTPKVVRAQQIAANAAANAAAAFTDFAAGQTPGEGTFVSVDGGSTIAAPSEDGSWLPWILGGIAVSAAVGGGIYYFTRNKKRK